MFSRIATYPASATNLGYDYAIELDLNFYAIFSRLCLFF